MLERLYIQNFMMADVIWIFIEKVKIKNRNKNYRLKRTKTSAFFELLRKGFCRVVLTTLYKIRLKSDLHFDNKFFLVLIFTANIYKAYF